MVHNYLNNLLYCNVIYKFPQMTLQHVSRSLLAEYGLLGEYLEFSLTTFVKF